MSDRDYERTGNSVLGVCSSIPCSSSWRRLGARSYNTRDDDECIAPPVSLTARESDRSRGDLASSRGMDMDGSDLESRAFFFTVTSIRCRVVRQVF